MRYKKILLALANGKRRNLSVAEQRVLDLWPEGVSNRTLKAAAYHNWAEFYHNGIWKIADAQNRVFVANYDDYIAMRIITDSSHDSVPQFQRFGFKGEGLRVKMN